MEGPHPAELAADEAWREMNGTLRVKITKRQIRWKRRLKEILGLDSTNRVKKQGAMTETKLCPFASDLARRWG